MTKISDKDIEYAKKLVYNFLEQKGINPLFVNTAPLIHKVLNHMLSTK